MPQLRSAIGILGLGVALGLGMAAPAGAQPPAAKLVADVRLVNFGGEAERGSCRLSVRFRNTSAVTADLILGVQTRDDQGHTLNTWVVPTGMLKANQSVQRYYSCHPATKLLVDRSSPRVWPNVCVIDGQRRQPCPIDVDVTSNLPVDGE